MFGKRMVSDHVTVQLNPDFDKYYGGYKKTVRVKETKRRFLARPLGWIAVLTVVATFIFDFPVTIILSSVYVIISLTAFFVKFN